MCRCDMSTVLGTWFSGGLVSAGQQQLYFMILEGFDSLILFCVEAL